MCKRVLQAAPFHKNTCDHAPEAALLAVSSFTETEDTGRVEVQSYDACFSFVSVHHELLFTESLSCIRKEKKTLSPSHTLMKSSCTSTQFRRTPHGESRYRRSRNRGKKGGGTKKQNLGRTWKGLELPPTWGWNWGYIHNKPLTLPLLESSCCPCSSSPMQPRANFWDLINWYYCLQAARDVLSCTERNRGPER